MSRFNVFYMIHKGLRALMYDVALNLQQTDFANGEVYPEALQKLSHLIEMFDAHAAHEDGFIFTLLSASNPDLQAAMEEEHVTDLALSNKIRSLMEAYKAATNDSLRAETGNKICMACYEFVAFNLDHLNKEEIIVNEALWAFYSDQEIMEANVRLLASLSEEQIINNATWILRGCSNADIARWLTMVRTEAPPRYLEMYLALAEEELPPHRFEAVQAAVMAVV